MHGSIKRRAKLRTANKTIETVFFYMVNTMNVWHNNCDDSDSSKYNVKFADLTGKEKEEWYDKIIKQKIKNFPSPEWFFSIFYVFIIERFLACQINTIGRRVTNEEKNSRQYN